MAYIIKESSILSDVVQEHVGLVPMLHRFGIRLGLGTQSVGEICKEKQIDTHFFLHILNSYLDPNYLGQVQITAKNIHLIADYLERANRHYLESLLPNVEIHLRSFVKASAPTNPVVQNVPGVLAELRATIMARIKQDEEELMPLFRSHTQDLEELWSDGILLNEEQRSTHLEEEDNAEALVVDIMQVLIRHISGDFNDNLLYGLLYSLSTLQSDLANNNRLRYRVFMPILKGLEKEV